MTTSFTPAAVLPTFDMMSGVQVVVLAPENGIVHIPGHDVIATSMFARIGHNLEISDPEGVKYIIKNFFISDHPPALKDGSGAFVDGAHAAEYAGPVNGNMYAQAGGAAKSAPIGQVRNVAGEGTIKHADGTVVPLKVGAQLFTDDVVTTAAGTTAGLVLADGTTLAMDAKAELVLDELIYDPATHGGTEKVSLVSGAASFVSGQIAKSGQDHMVFKTPVATIGIRGTKVFAQFDPVTGDITILNRPVADASGNMGVGKIALFMPDGSFAGEITTANSAWKFNPSKGESPTQVQFTEAQVQNIAGKVDAIVNTMAAQVHQEQQQNNGNLNLQGNGDNKGDNGNKNEGGGDKGNSGGTKGGDSGGGGDKTGDAKDAKTDKSDSKSDSKSDTKGDTKTDAPVTKDIAPTGNKTFNSDGSNPGSSTPGNSSSPSNPSNPGNSSTPSFTPISTPTTGTPTTTTPTPTTTTTTQQPIIQPTQITVDGDGATHARPGSATFTITRVNNLDQTTTVNYSTSDGDAHSGVDYKATSGSVTFDKGETSKTVSVDILIGNRATTTESLSFSLAVSGGAGIAGGSFAVAVIAPPPPLPTITIGDAVTTDTVAGTVTLTLTRTGDTSLPSTVKFSTVDGSATSGSDYGAASNTVTFGKGQTTATITISILANSTPLTIHNREGVETFTVQLSDAVDAKLGDASKGTVTISADPVVGLANFSVSSATTTHAGGSVATLTITRSGDLVGQVTVKYSTADGSAVAGTDYKAVSGTLTFAPNETTKTVPVTILGVTGNTPARQFTLVLSDPDGGNITSGTGGISIAARSVPTISISGTTVGDAVQSTANVTVSLSSAFDDTITVKFATSGGNPGTDYSASSGTLTFSPGTTSQTISINIPAQPTKTSDSSFAVVLSDATNAVIGSDTAVVTISGNTVTVPTTPVVTPTGPNTAPKGPGSTFLAPVNPGNTSPSGSTVANLFLGLFADQDTGNVQSGIAIGANTASATQGEWQYSSDNGVTWRAIGTVSTSNPLVVAITSLIRFVPAGGFFGTPTPLQAAVMDNTYTGLFSSSATNTPVYLASPSYGGTSFLASSLSIINTAVLTVDSMSSGDWAAPGSWTLGAVPNAGQFAALTGTTVTLSNGTTNTVAFLGVSSITSLTISGANTVLASTLGINTAAGSTITIPSGALSTDGTFTNSGTINLTGGNLQGLGNLVNLGTLSVSGAGSKVAIDVTNVGGFGITTAATVSGAFTNISSATVHIGTGAAALFTGAVTNHGNFNFEGGTSLSFPGGFLNQGVGVLNLGAAGGTIAGGISNQLGTINVTASTTLVGGALVNGDSTLVSGASTLNVGTGATLTISPGTSLVQQTTGIFTGSGTNGTSNGKITISDGAQFVVLTSSMIGAGLSVALGGPATGAGALLGGGGMLTIKGTLGVGASSTVTTPITVFGTGFGSASGSMSAVGEATFNGGSITTQSGSVFAIAGLPTLDANVRVKGTLQVGGNITLLAVSGSSNPSDPVSPSDVTLDVSNATFTVLSGGSLNSLTSVTPGQGGGGRTIFGNVTLNSGASFNVLIDTLYLGGTLSNSGNVHVNSGASLTIGPDSTLTINSGATLSGTGTNTGTFGRIVVGHGGQMSFNGSGTIGPGLVVQIGDDSGPGTLLGPSSGSVLSISGALRAVDGTIGNGFSAGNPLTNIEVKPGGTFALLNSQLVTVSGMVTVDSGGFMVVVGSANDAYVTFGTPSLLGWVSNNGTTTLTAAATVPNGPVVARDVTLDLSQARFFNNAGAFFQVLAGPTGNPVGGGRTIVLGSYGFSNSGTFSIQSDTAFTPYNDGLNFGFSNMSGALFIVNAGATADFYTMGSSGGLENDGGTITINGALNMHGGSLRNNSGTINGSGTINMGGGSFINTGTSFITPGNSPGHLTIDGSAAFGEGTHTQIQLAGTAAGQFDVLDVSHHFTLGGSLDVQGYNGFAPQIGDSFHVMNWGSADGMFGSTTGLVSGNIALDPVFSDSGLTLVARMITQQAGAGDEILTGGTGPNVLVGGSGNTTLIAGPSGDLMIGGKGNTTFVPGAGNDHMIGGAGANTIDFSHQSTPVTVDLSQGTATSGTGNHDTLIGIPNVVGTSGADTITGDGHDNVITGGGGADTLIGGDGHNTFRYTGTGDGGDTIKDFTSGKDIFAFLQSAFGVGPTVTEGQNFSVITQAFNGTNAGVNASFDAGQPTFVYSTHDNALYYDPHGAGPGYTLIAHVEPGAVVTAHDIHLFQGANV